MPPPPEDLPTLSSSYTLHPLRALDGVLVYCTRNGEYVTAAFGADEREAAEALARELPELMPASGERS